MARQVLVLHPAAHQAKAKHTRSVRCHPLHLNMPAHQTNSAHGKAAARAASCSMSSLRQSSAPIQCDATPAASQHANGPNHCPWQGNCPCHIPQHIDVKAKHPSSAMPAAASQHANRPKTIADDKAIARAASRSKPIKANHPSNAMPPAAPQHDSGPKHRLSMARHVLVLHPAAHQFKAKAHI